MCSANAPDSPAWNVSASASQAMRPVATVAAAAVSNVTKSAVAMPPVRPVIDVMSAFAPDAAALRFARAPVASVAPVPPSATPRVPIKSALPKSTTSRGLIANTRFAPAAKSMRLPVLLSLNVPRDSVSGDVNAVSQISHWPVGRPALSTASMTIVAVSALANSAANAR